LRLMEPLPEMPDIFGASTSIYISCTTGTQGKLLVQDLVLSHYITEPDISFLYIWEM
jgi:hypothetical protein